MIQNKEIRFEKLQILTKNPKFQNSIRKNPNFVENPKFQNGHIYNFHASKNQNLEKIQILIKFPHFYPPLGGLFVYICI